MRSEASNIVAAMRTLMNDLPTGGDPQLEPTTVHTQGQPPSHIEIAKRTGRETGQQAAGTTAAQAGRAAHRIHIASNDDRTESNTWASRRQTGSILHMGVSQAGRGRHSHGHRTDEQGTSSSEVPLRRRARAAGARRASRGDLGLLDSDRVV